MTNTTNTEYIIVDARSIFHRLRFSHSNASDALDHFPIAYRFASECIPPEKGQYMKVFFETSFRHGGPDEMISFVLDSGASISLKFKRHVIFTLPGGAEISHSAKIQREYVYISIDIARQLWKMLATKGWTSTPVFSAFAIPPDQHNKKEGTAQ